jgi:predicted aspartyl protease
MEEYPNNRYGPLTATRHFAITRLYVGGVIWRDIEPGYERMPAALNTDSAMEYRCLIDTGANWCSVTRDVAEELDLVEFDAPSPATLGQPQEGVESVRAAIITVVVGRQAIPAPTYINLPQVSGDQYDVLIGTTVLQCLQFTYDGPDGTYSIGPF